MYILYSECNEATYYGFTFKTGMGMSHTSLGKLSHVSGYAPQDLVGKD
jgi:hypothetical protein